MINTFRLALSVPSPYFRRRIYFCIPLAIGVAMIEAASFGLLFLLLQVIDRPDDVEKGLLGTLYDLSGLETHSSFLWTIGVGIAVLMLVKGIAAVALLWWQTSLVSRAEAESSSRLFEAYVQAPHSFHLKTNSAYIVRNVLQSMATVYQNVLLGLVTTGTEAAVVVTVAIVLFASNPLVAVMTGILMITASVGFMKGLSRFSRRLGRHNQLMLKRVLQSTAEGIEGVTMVQVLNQQDNVSRSYAEMRSEWAVTRRSMLFVAQLPRYYLEFVLLLGVAAIGLGASALTSGTDTVAVVGVMIAAALRMIPSLNKILSSLNKVHVGRSATVEIVREMEHVARMEEEKVSASTADPVRFDRSIELQNLTFTYDDTEVPALREIDLKITKGESIGIVGESGSGKSTLVNVLLGLHWPGDSSILIDGVALRRESLAGWRDQVGYVPQEIFLSDSSLRRNIAFGVPKDEIDDARVESAVHMALLADFVATLPEGLDTTTGEHGVRFSGGQRQRVGIARALYPQPQLLLLDEATSALDTITEAAVARTIDALHGQLTLVIVAHRLSTVRNCDRILLIKDGRIEADGSFTELADESADFAEMLRRSNAGSVVGDDPGVRASIGPNQGA